MTKERVLVGLSGGVDSAVSALLLQRAGYEVVGGFIRTWHPEFVQCSEEHDRLEAMRVASFLGIPLITIDAREAYKADVADVMIREYRAGRTPNPDILCNRVVKFGVMDRAREDIGAQYLATGHYARVVPTGDEHTLVQGVDPRKDQSYFLAHMERDVLRRTLFPIGHMTKTQVRDIARDAKLPNAERKDSQGICFLGEIDMRSFLAHYIDLVPGTVLTEDGVTIGTHDGAALYTLGERHGFRVTDPTHAKVPQYVIAKDVGANTITVAPEPPRFSSHDSITLSAWHELAANVTEGSYDAVFRYHGERVPVTLCMTGGRYQIELLRAAERPSPGQTCVLYSGEQVIASGIIEFE